MMINRTSSDLFNKDGMNDAPRKSKRPANLRHLWTFL